MNEQFSLGAIEPIKELSEKGQNGLAAMGRVFNIENFSLDGISIQEMKEISNEDEDTNNSFKQAA